MQAPPEDDEKPAPAVGDTMRPALAATESADEPVKRAAFEVHDVDEPSILKEAENLGVTKSPQ